MKFIGYFKEPAFVNALQTAGYCVAIAGGFLAATGGLPHIVTGQIGSVLATVIGSFLMVGGLAGAYAVYRGQWALEQAVIWIVGIQYFALFLATLTFALAGKSQTSTIWLVVVLEVLAIIDCAKRYRRIDWAYLDPAK